MPNDSVQAYIRALADQGTKPDVAAAEAWEACVPDAVRDRYPTGSRLLEALMSELRRRDQEQHIAMLRATIAAGDRPLAAPAAASTAAVEPSESEDYPFGRPGRGLGAFNANWRPYDARALPPPRLSHAPGPPADRPAAGLLLRPLPGRRPPGAAAAVGSLLLPVI
jgi:hypothetical protein